MGLNRIFQERVDIVNKELKKVVGDKVEPAEFYEPIEYHIFGGGKRVRPILCLLACEAVSGEYNKALPMAASLELVHAFTLVHDDIMDKDTTRRGKPTIYSKWGEPLAINAGDGIFAKAYASILNLETPLEIAAKAVKALSASIIEVCEGQAMDISFEKKENISKAEYLDMAERKTASLIAAATHTGAIIGGGNDNEINALENYGRKVGLAFQIWDDYIDFASENTGKTYGSDIKKGKKTFIVCHSLEYANANQKKRLQHILKTPVDETGPEMIAEAVEILNTTGSIKYAKEYSEGLIDEAKVALNILEESDAKTALEEFADFVILREN